MAAGDFDGDANDDLLIVANDYSAIPAHGRFDSGLGWLLHGDGRGGFDPVPVAESGWIVPGNAKALAMVDLDRDARPDAVVTRNNETALAFRQEASAESVSLGLRLRGRGGNPDAIGARVRVVTGDSVLQVAEVRAGGGFASQSSATVFLSVPRAAAPDATLHIRWPSGVTLKMPCPQRSGYVTIRE